MTPKLLLTLWRERWGKADDVEPRTMYEVGRQEPWDWPLTQPMGWAGPGVIAAVSVMALGLLALVSTPGFSLIGQVAFSAPLIGAVIYLRRHAGTMALFMLLALSIVVTVRYFFWRLETTLGHSSDLLPFALGFTLLVAELHIAIVMALRKALAVWPLHRPVQALPAHRDAWPTVDVFVLCDKQPPALLESLFQTARTLRWPVDKVQLYLIDLQERPELRERALAKGAIYLSSVGLRMPEALENALHHSQGALITIVDGVNSLPPAFLRHVVGWFVHDSRLAMVHSPHHFLGSTTSPRCLQTLRSQGEPFSCAVVRRSSWLETLVLPSTVAPELVLALQLRDKGYRCACFGQAPPSQADGGMSGDDKAGWVMIEPDSDAALSWRQALATSYGVLSFYNPVAWLVLLTAPLAYLLFGVHVIQGTVALFAAYAIPHWVHSYAWGRAQGSRRRTIFNELHELLLSCQLLVITACTFLRTELSRFIRPRAAGRFEAGKPPVDRSRAVALGLWGVLNACAIVVGAMRLPLEDGPQRGFALVYLLWAAYNVLIVLAWAAVAQEARHIRWYTQRQACKPAMIRLPHGRTLACTTQNFPSAELDLTLATPCHFVRRSTVSMAVLSEGREQALKAEVVGRSGNLLRVRVRAASLPDYSVLAAWSQSRTGDWPQWLPSRDADRLMPIWLYRVVGYGLSMAQRAFAFFRPASTR